MFNAEVLKGAFVLQAVEEANGNERLLASTNLLPGGTGDDGSSVAQNFTLTITPQTSTVSLRLSAPQNLGSVGVGVSAVATSGGISVSPGQYTLVSHRVTVKVNYLEQEQFTVTLCDSIDDKYRFGFNGMEKDNELKGVGNSLDYGFRMYDSRVARWLSLDPLAAEYPSMSPYNFVANSPLIFIDPDGKVIRIYTTIGTENNTKILIATINGEDVIKENNSESINNQFSYYDNSKKYLQNHTKIFAQLETSDITYDIVFSDINARSTAYEPNQYEVIDDKPVFNDSYGGAISWNPFLAIKDWDQNYHSPALVLAHEMSHASHADIDLSQFIIDKNTLIMGDVPTSSPEEVRTIRDVNIISKRLNTGDGGGTPTSRSYDGFSRSYKVSDQTTFLPEPETTNSDVNSSSPNSGN